MAHNAMSISETITFREGSGGSVVVSKFDFNIGAHGQVCSPIPFFVLLPFSICIVDIIPPNSSSPSIASCGN